LQRLLGLSLLLLTEHGIALGDNSLLLTLAGSLGLSTSAVHLLLDESLTGGLSLGLVDLRILSVYSVDSAYNTTYVLN